MQTLKGVLNVLIFLALVGFIANSLFRIGVFFLHGS